ncbi:scoloptoxin SSD14 [Aedes albopictus]|uniref:Gamma-glutamyltransferase n=1 Tax=Aedes albopictus TaxID=7160 RepID=A0ABM1Z519_AEDAL|nr:scoloptoxin SSD14-like [Aedes albopictus]
MLLKISRKKLILLMVGTIVGVTVFTLAAVYVLHEEEVEDVLDIDDDEDEGGSKRVGAVASNAYECAEIGADILRANGSAADAAIAMMICEEIACPESAGIGGGFLLTLYERETGKVLVMDAREIAARASREDMFVNFKNGTAHGALAIATPGALKGYWVLHEKFGKLPWRKLIEPSIELCYRGHIVNPYMEDAMLDIRKEILETPSLREIFVNPETGDVWRDGDRIYRPDFAETLKVIADEGSNALYSRNGSLLPKLMQDLKEFGSILTEEDFYRYEPRWFTPVSTKVRGDNTVYSAALPGGGTILVHMLNVLNGYPNLNPNDPVTWQRVVETFKHAYGVRTRLGDPSFVPGIEELLRNLTDQGYADNIRDKIKDDRTFYDYDYYGADFSPSEDHGTAHVSVLAPNGDAIAVTSTINDYFGAQLRSPRTGIILNGEMDDFSVPGVINIFGVPASPANFIAPGKRPLSSMSPTIVVDGKGNVRLIAGGAGGTRITTATLQIILRKMFFGQSLESAMDGFRIHHQLAPMEVEYEDDVDETVLEQLRARGHSLKKVKRVATMTAVAREDDSRVTAAFDPRRPGSVAIVEL